MASPCNHKCFRNPRLSLWWLTLLFTMMWHSSVAESAAKIQLRGEVGGNVTFLCPKTKTVRSTVLFLYFQRGHTFVNGFYSSKNISEAWENTRVDPNKTSMDMHNLNVSHGGDYQCIIRYSDNEMVETGIHLSITGNYSKPSVTTNCDEHRRIRCLVTCSSHGGYPSTKVTWNVLESQMWTIVNSSERSDPDTMLVNSSSVAYFNCSNGELKSLSCSVGDVISDMFSVCTPKDSSHTYSMYVIAAIFVIVAICVMAALLLWRYMKGKGGSAAVI